MSSLCDASVCLSWGLGRYPWAPADALDLLRQLLAFFPEDRITAQDALAHPFFAPVRRVSAEVRPCSVHVVAVHSKAKTGQGGLCNPGWLTQLPLPTHARVAAVALGTGQLCS